MNFHFRFHFFSQQIYFIDLDFEITVLEKNQNAICKKKLLVAHACWVFSNTNTRKINTKTKGVVVNKTLINVNNGLF